VNLVFQVVFDFLEDFVPLSFFSVLTLLFVLWSFSSFFNLLDLPPIIFKIDYFHTELLVYYSHIIRISYFSF